MPHDADAAAVAPSGTDQVSQALLTGAIQGSRGASIDELDEAVPVPRPGPIEATVIDIERTWLGLHAGGLALRAAQGHWRPDSIDASCPRCGQSVGAYEVDPARASCPRCRGKRLPWARLVRLGEYVPPLSRMVRDVKFSRARVLGLELGRLLGARVRSAMGDGAPAESAAAAPTGSFDPQRWIIVPVPTSWPHRLSRGIDHALTISRGASRELGVPIVPLLSRRHRLSQTRVPRSSRAANVAGTMHAGHAAPLFASLGLGPWAEARRWSARAAGATPNQPATALGAVHSAPGVEGPGGGATGPAGRESWGILLIDDVTTTGATLREACRALRAGFLKFRMPPPAVVVGVVAVTGLRTGGLDELT